MERYYAHSTKEQEKEGWQSLEQHLWMVAKKLAFFSEKFATEEVAHLIGLLHDAGKYQKSFQKRLEGSPVPVEHSIYGSQVWVELGIPDGGAYCIAGHHAGLPNVGSITDTNQDSTLLGRLQRNMEDCSGFREEITLPTVPLKSHIWKKAIQGQSQLQCQKEYAFWIRMMFSCLVDADFLDTEEFYGKHRVSTSSNSLTQAEVVFSNMLNQLKQETLLAKTRSVLLKQVLSQTEEEASLYLLNMPTGSGKTFVSTAFALKRAVSTGKKRIIYVIPYQSITQQVASTLKEILGEDMVLEHHSSFSYESKEESGELEEKWKNASENWDFPVIVTTTVQFFESIYSNKSSKMRKLHNISDAMLIFDEVHLLPRLFLQPCLEAIQILTQRYGCEALFLSATMPNLPQWMEQYQGEPWKQQNLLPDKTLFPRFDTCYFATLHGVSEDYFLEVLSQQKRALVVVNLKKTARSLYQQITGKKFHLSTDMTPEHRREAIEKIKIALAQEEKLTVISTSLIEAGVDLDFDSAFRELSGLDNLLQTAGRCNREGKKENCVTYSFSFSQEERAQEEFRLRQSLTLKVFEKVERGEFTTISSPEAVDYYYSQYFQQREEDFSIHDFAQYITKQSVHPRDVGFRFADYANDFHLIPDDTINVVIIRAKNKEMLESLREQFRFLKGGGATYHRLWGDHTVSLRKHTFQSLWEQGVVSETKGVYFLDNSHYYSEELGILIEDTQPEHYIF